jgi:Na+/H+-dicarboxylate symporter
LLKNLISILNSSAALPKTQMCIIEKNKISESIAKFILPIGAVINMDAAAIYQIVAVIFIAQLNNRYLDIVDLTIASLITTLASIGCASIPGSAVTSMLMVLNALNLPTHQISIIFAADWIMYKRFEFNFNFCFFF